MDSRKSWIYIGLYLAGMVCAAGADDQEHFSALGLENEASQMAVQLAYTNITKSYTPGVLTGDAVRRSFVKAQDAFEALANAEMKEEALQAVNYWDHVQRLEGDEELQHFTEFQPGGSAALRIIYVLEKLEDRRWPIFATATLLDGRVRVGQLSYKDALDAGGEPGRFLTTLRLRQYPATVLYDPVSRAIRTVHGVEGVEKEARRLLDGQHSPTDKISRIQDLDTESYNMRCGGAEGGSGERCGFSFVFATSAAIEGKKEELMTVFKPFMEACRNLQTIREETSQTAACFWLRFSRASEWEAFLRKKGAGAGDLVISAMQNQEGRGPGLVVAPAGIATADADLIQGWFRDTISAGDMPELTESLPMLPRPLTSSEEPQEQAAALFMRNIYRNLGQVEVLFVKGEAAFRELNTEDKTMVVGAIMCALLLISFVCKNCCCGRRAALVPEDEAVQKVSPVIDVVLRRVEGQRLGIGIASNDQDTFSVTSVEDGQALAGWNSTEMCMEKRVKAGDRIISVTYQGDGGQLVRATACTQMNEAMRSGKDVTLGVALARTAAEVQSFMQLITGTVILDKLVLKDVAELGQPLRSSTASLDAMTVEIVGIGPGLSTFNESRRGDGACCMQQLEVGDRIVSLNSFTDVKTHLAEPSPQLLVARWRPSGTVQAKNLEVNISRSSPEDRMGMHIRQQPGSSIVEVLEVVEGNAIHRWNSTPGNSPVLKGDRIVSVNGKSEYAEIQKELGSMNLAIQVERWVDAGSNGNTFAPTSGFGAPAGPGMGASPMLPKPAVIAAAPAAKDGEAAAVIGVPWRGAVIVSAIALTVLGDGPTTVSAVHALQSQLVQVARSIASAIPRQWHANSAMLMLFVGLILSVRFLWYEARMATKPSERSTVSQVVVALVASVSLGYGNFFLLTWAGVYA